MLLLKAIMVASSAMVYSFLGIFLMAVLNVIVESVKQDKTPNTIVREWSETYLPVMEQRAKELWNKF